MMDENKNNNKPKTKSCNISCYRLIGVLMFVVIIVFLFLVHLYAPHTKSEISADGMLEYIINGIGMA